MAVATSSIYDVISHPFVSYDIEDDELFGQEYDFNSSVFVSMDEYPMVSDVSYIDADSGEYSSQLVPLDTGSPSLNDFLFEDMVLLSSEESSFQEVSLIRNNIVPLVPVFLSDKIVSMGLDVYFISMNNSLFNVMETSGYTTSNIESILDAIRFVSYDESIFGEESGYTTLSIESILDAIRFVSYDESIFGEETDLPYNTYTYSDIVDTLNVVSYGDTSYDQEYPVLSIPVIVYSMPPVEIDSSVQDMEASKMSKYDFEYNGEGMYYAETAIFNFKGYYAVVSLRINRMIYPKSSITVKGKKGRQC